MCIYVLPKATTPSPAILKLWPLIVMIDSDLTGTFQCSAGYRKMVKLKGLRTKDGRLAAVVAREHGVSMSALTSRLHAGWTVEEACEVPL
jgi:hypothetical protein